MPAFFNPGQAAFALDPTGVVVFAFRSNNAPDVAKLANKFLRSLDPNPVDLLDFQLTAGGGGNVDLTIAIRAVGTSLTGEFPDTEFVEFVGFESVDGLSFQTEVNRVLDGTQPIPPFAEVVGWATATGATAGKLCGVLLLFGVEDVVREFRARASAGAGAKPALPKPATSSAAKPAAAAAPLAFSTLLARPFVTKKGG